MNGWMNGWMGGWDDKSMNRCGRIYRWMGGCEWMEGWRNGWV